jgi:hypothetical protein
MENHVRLSNDLWLVPNSGILFDFSARDSAFSDKGFEAKLGEFKFCKWGKNNLLPQEMIDLVTKNHLKPKLLATEQEYLLGSGLRIFKKTIVGGKEKLERAENYAMESFLDSFDHSAFMDRLSNNFVMTSNYFVDFIFNSIGQVYSMESLDCTETRAGIIPDGYRTIQEFGTLPDWSKTVSDSNPLTRIAALNPKVLQARAVMHGRLEQMGQPYYSWAQWWGTENWTWVSNLIPLFHKAGLGNGYNIKYLIKVPKTYFDRVANSDDEREAKRKELRDSFDGFFSGTDNADKSIWSTYDIDGAGKQMPGIIVETIGRTDSDKAYIELDNQANQNQAIGHGVAPALIGLGDGAKLGGSGSELRIASQLHISQKTPRARDLLLKPFKFAGKRNGWPKDHFIGFADIEITTLDVNPTGKQPVVNG